MGQRRAQSLEETERLVTEAQGLPPPFPPLSTLPDMHFGDSAIDGIMVPLPPPLPPPHRPAPAAPDPATLHARRRSRPLPNSAGVASAWAF